MEKFKISDIQEIFTTDVERFHGLTQQYVLQLLNEERVSQEALDEALRQCHTLKGLAATVEAWGLSCLGADFEKLLELAGSWAHNEREKANEVFQFILEHMQDWFVMNQFTCMDMLAQAWDVYQGLRVIMDERWPGHLPVVGAGLTDAQYVRLTELEISELDGTSGEAKEDLDVQGAQPLAAQSVAPSGAPLPVRVVPPTLRARVEPGETAGSAEETPVASSQSAEATSGEVTAQADQLATPKPLQVVPPTLRRRDVTQETKPQDESVTAESAANGPVEQVAPAIETTAAQTELPSTAEADEVPPTTKADSDGSPGTGASTPPLLRVAPPALKRRGRKSERAKETELPERPAEAVAQAAEVTAPAPVEPAAEALSAEAIFAALPENVEAGPTAAAPVEAKSTEEFQPGADADLLEMLSQEVAGYLTELAVSLSATAENLAAQEPWEKSRRLFHTIKGTAATFGLDTVSAPAKAAEARCVAAVDEVAARNRETFETCAHLAATVAKSLRLPFDESRLRETLELGFAQAANAAAASAPAPVTDLDPEMAGFFINDTRDQIGIIEQAVLRWEKGEKPTEQIWAAQRGFHTIKGAGNSIGLTAVAQSVHEVEAFLEDLAGKGAKGSKAIFTFLFGAVDQLRRYLVGLAKNATTPWRHDWSTALRLLSEPGAADEAEVVSVQEDPRLQSPAKSSVNDDEDDDAQTIRVETARLYQLMNLISEMVIDRARLARKIEQLAALHRALAERNGALTGSVLSFQEQFEFNLMQQAAAESEAERVEGRGSKVEGRRPGAAGAGHGHGEFSELEFDRYDQFNVLARSLVEISHDIEQLNGDVAACLDSFAAENVHFTQTSQELQRRVTGLGLVPVKTLFPRLQRAFRDALEVEGKEGELLLVGGEAMLDKVVVDKVYAPLLHLLRNAVAHGIEDGATRRERQKPARGRVRLSAAQLSNQIVLQLSDDGAGVDVGVVRARAVEKGWLSPEAAELADPQVVEFLFRPGFSTASKVTSVSGRGIGLDVVRQEVENLNGAVELKYVAGQGCTWTLRLPLTLAISEAILAEVGGVQYAFPLNFVEAGLILDPERMIKSNSESRIQNSELLRESGNSQIQTSLTHQVEQYPVERRDLGDGSDLASGQGANPLDASAENQEPKFDLLPVVRLSRLFGAAGNGDSTKGLVACVGDRRAVLVVDVVLRRQEIVVKQLDVVMAQHPLLNGASVDAEGRVIPILNLPALLKLGDRGLVDGSKLMVDGGLPFSTTNAPASTLNARQRRVLVVDDSLSVRKVQERLLRDLGCEVVVARDGLEGLERLREAAHDAACVSGAELPFDLILTDLEMPRLNGYELISEVRGNPAWAAVPVVVISSRGADKYITKAMNAGARTFLCKPFTQGQLREVLGRFCG